MVKGEIIQLRGIIESFQGAIGGNNQELMYDLLAQADALYASAIPELSEAFETAKDNSGLVNRQSNVVLQLLKRYLIRNESVEDGMTNRGNKSNVKETTRMDTQEYMQRVYRVITCVLHMPDASPNVLAEKCSISVPDFFEVLDFAQKEGLIDGVRFATGGHGRAPLAAFYDTAKRTLKGLKFMNQFETNGIPQLRAEERPTVFISYNQRSGSSFVDSLEEALAPCANVLRDTSSLKDWESFSDFMKSIRKQDFAVMVITPDYLRSEACMCEVSELMKDDDWRQKVMFAVLDTSIYSDTIAEYIQYWQEQESALRKRASDIDLKNTVPIANKLNKISDIQRCFGAFFEAICDSNNPKPWDIKDRIIDRIRTTSNNSFLEELNNTQYATEKEEQIRKLLE